MSRGKHLSLEEARKQDKLERFAKEHPSTGDKKLFDRLFQAMAKKPKEDVWLQKPSMIRRRS